MLNENLEDNSMLSWVEFCVVLANDNESIVLEHGVFHKMDDAAARL